jgi:hypothetical protein
MKEFSNSKNNTKKEGAKSVDFWHFKLPDGVHKPPAQQRVILFVPKKTSELVNVIIQKNDNKFDQLINFQMDTLTALQSSIKGSDNGRGSNGAGNDGSSMNLGK